MRFPHYNQLDAMDCGPAALRIIAAYYGRKFSQLELREKCHITRMGVSMRGIADAAEALGFETEGVKLTFEELRTDVKLPCIVHWNRNHFIVVYKVTGKPGSYKVHVSDPAHGLLKYDQERFMKCWIQGTDDKGNSKGLALLMQPTDEFYETNPPKKQPVGFKFMMKYLRPYRAQIVQVFLGLIAGSLLSLIFPFLTQAVVDIGIGNRDINFVVLILIAQLALSFGQMANSLIRSWLMLHMTTRISISLIYDFLRKLMRLPIAFFDSKKFGDIMQRIGDHSRIQSFITGTLISIIMAFVTFIVYACLMGIYDMGILLVFMGGSAVYAAWVIIFLRRRRKLDYMRFQESAENQSNMVQLIAGMQDIKLNNCEDQKLQEWEDIQIRLFRVSIKSLTLNQTQQVGGMLIDQAKNIIISYLAARSVIEGGMTLGMMMALQYVIGQLNGPVSQFISLIQTTQDAKISMERLNEIHDRRDEEPEESRKIAQVPSDADLTFDNVVFRYGGAHAENILDGISLHIPAGKVTAIVGPSGSGKTTMLKLILRFYDPAEGELLLGNRPISEFSDGKWRGNCGVVMQEGYIFADTIARNIAVAEEEPDMEKVKRAADIAELSSFVDELPMAYETKIGSDGQGVSSGQRQRILIARAVYKNSPYIIFDEATNALDANTEKKVMENLRKYFRGRTVIIVAHRLSTVKNADNIVVLNGGKLVEEGNHNSLVKKRGYYFQLVSNQLELDS